MQEKWKIMVARFPHGGSERAEVTNWLVAVALWAKRLDIELLHWMANDTPITMLRNRAVKDAIDAGADLLVMVDSDMGPDKLATQPFLPAAFEFTRQRWQAAPTIVAAPYSGGLPDRLPMMGTFREYLEGRPVKAQLLTRAEAASFHGILSCPYLGTGLMLLDLRIFTGFNGVALKPPWFHYEYTDEYHTAKAASEDMEFSLQTWFAFGGIGLEVNFCAWDSWSEHYKVGGMGAPTPLDFIGLALRLTNERPHEELE
jgi:hypothetical protein